MEENLIIDWENKEVTIGEEKYSLIYHTNEQLGDDSTCDRGVSTLILFNPKKQEHYLLYSRYYTIIDEDEGYKAVYEEWGIKQL